MRLALFLHRTSSKLPMITRTSVKDLQKTGFSVAK